MAASGGAGGLGRANAVDVAQVQQAAATADAKEIIATQEQSSISLIKDNQDVSNPAAATRTKKKEEKFQTLESRRKGGAAQTEKKSEATEEKSDADLADKYTENNSEISAGDLRSIRDSLKNDASEDYILSLLQSKFSDPALQSIALNYLIQSTPNALGALLDTLVRAQQRHTQPNHQ